MSVPLGSYPGGYHLEDFGERLTNSGAEATMVFVGPSLFRYDLIGAYFPLWFFTSNPSTGLCCADLIPNTGPTAYPDLLSAQIDETVQCGVFGSCLWPDTYSVGPGSTTCTPQPLPCDTPIANLAIMRPLYYSDGTADQCDARITINFRRKHHAGWPRFMHPCAGEEVFWGPPKIPNGTFIEVRRNPNTQAKPINASGLNWVVDEEYRWKNTVGGQNCENTSYPLGPAADWCDKAATIDKSMQFGALVFAQEIEVRWSGVPIADWSVLRELEGTTNAGVFLGNPPESVVFHHYEEEETPMFGCQDLFTIILHFNVMTGSVDTSTSSLTKEEMLIRGIYNNRVGLWNRFWSPQPIVIGADDVCTNWVPFRNSVQNCCGSSNLKVYKAECHQRLFTIPACPP